MAPPRGHHEHGQFSIDAYRLEVLNKTQMSDQGSLGQFYCVSILDMISQNMINVVSICNVYYMYVIFII